MLDGVVTNVPPDFPSLRRALTRARAASARRLAAFGDETLPPGTDDIEERKESRAWARAKQAYGDVLLQPITGVGWIWASPMSQGTGLVYPRTVDDRPLVTECPRLLGRPLVFVRKGAPAPLAASSCAFVAEPYSMFAGDGSLDDLARGEAGLLAEIGYGVWARPGSGPTQWDEPDLCLLLATAGLTADRAPEFGFTALAQVG